MSLKRIFQWRCDTCGKTQENDGYGLPRGWVWVVRKGAIEHACETCEASIPPRLKGRSGQLKAGE